VTAPRGLTVWLTGLPGSGKTTTALALTERLHALGERSVTLDGDILRSGLNRDLGFSDADRNESVRRAGEVALLLASTDCIVIVSLVSPFRIARDAVRARHAESEVSFLEVHIAAPLDVCEERDPKGLYAKARSGTVASMTGIDSPYEEPLHPELTLATDVDDVETSVQHLVDAVLAQRR
jgi:bifunctional enzyme CysN/CysC